MKTRGTQQHPGIKFPTAEHQHNFDKDGCQLTKLSAKNSSFPYCNPHKNIHINFLSFMINIPAYWLTTWCWCVIILTGGDVPYGFTADGCPPELRYDVFLLAGDGGENMGMAISQYQSINQSISQGSRYMCEVVKQAINGRVNQSRWQVHVWSCQASNQSFDQGGRNICRKKEKQWKRKTQQKRAFWSMRTCTTHNTMHKRFYFFFESYIGLVGLLQLFSLNCYNFSCSWWNR